MVVAFLCRLLINKKPNGADVDSLAMVWSGTIGIWQKQWQAIVNGL